MKDVMGVIDLIEEMVESSSKFLTPNKAVLDKKEILEYLRVIRISLPDEIKQANWLKSERTRFIDDAKREAETILSEARKESANLMDYAKYERQLMIDDASSEASKMVDEQSILVEAREDAQKIIDEAREDCEDIIDKAQAESDKIMRNAYAYASEILGTLEEALGNSLEEIISNKNAIENKLR